MPPTYRHTNIHASSCPRRARTHAYVTRTEGLAPKTHSHAKRAQYRNRRANRFTVEPLNSPLCHANRSNEGRRVSAWNTQRDVNSLRGWDYVLRYK
jgi:hypothetical protein